MAAEGRQLDDVAAEAEDEGDGPWADVREEKAVDRAL